MISLIQSWPRVGLAHQGMTFYSRSFQWIRNSNTTFLEGKSVLNNPLNCVQMVFVTPTLGVKMKTTLSWKLCSDLSLCVSVSQDVHDHPKNPTVQ